MIKMRSWLFAPGDSERKMEKATASNADIVIFDLEDAVSEPEKPKARTRVASFLKANAQHRSKLWVRINPIQGPHALADLAAVMPAAPVGIMFPKPRGRADAELLDHYLTAFEAAAGTEIGSTQVMLLATEMPESMLAIGSYAGVPRIVAMSWGAEDLATALGASDNRGDYGGYDFTYELARSLCLVGAAAAGVAAIETIHGDFKDEPGLRKRAAAMRRAGWRGMLAIHPAQVDVINEAFSPSAEEVAAAQEIVDLFAANPGVGTIGHKGAMLDRPHLARAKQLLASVGRS
ncbi:HpcH/HpaI aldolase/citrate lyase family protein [Steroidobacter agaridevorans]|uniref:HpcH/HpaI aldolase/citrate lyase family protein n=1 Tax=Steroidobacter agaridevorans TaxID=2695856 RepID=UPI0013274E4D|nr:CoA ester lyase [Steroidobacter agaridevorans]GFE90691.1 CoA ester lyase [Steroidobacter agaridevorans]